MSQNFNENNSDEKFAYQNVMDTNRNTRTFSIVSLIAAVLSIILCFLPTLGIIFGVLAVSFSLFSRKRLGYFDGFSLAGLILGIIGIVFSAFALILRNIIVAAIASLFA